MKRETALLTINMKHQGMGMHYCSTDVKTKRNILAPGPDVIHRRITNRTTTFSSCRRTYGCNFWSLYKGL